jgi:ABC-2 type transport system ATP-binding protein
MSMAIARLVGITKRYGESLALDQVDLAIGEGEIVGLLGPNGAGKTTLIHCLVGLIGFDEGHIEVFGMAQQQHLNEIKRHIGLVTQEITVFEDLTARENLQFFGEIYGLRGAELHERIDATLDLVGLTDHANNLPGKFSGGMKRRLNIACALVHEPRFLIMDEPTVGIDPQSRYNILQSVRTLNNNGATILYATHYMEEAQAIASRVVIVDRAQIIAQGTVEELIKTVQAEERIRIEVARPDEALLERLRRLEGVTEVTQNGAQIRVTSLLGAGNLDTILSVAREAGGILSVTSEQPTLEDVFLALTGRTLRDRAESPS